MSGFYLADEFVRNLEMTDERVSDEKGEKSCEDERTLTEEQW